MAIENWLMNEFHGTDIERTVKNGGKDGISDGRYDYRHMNEIYEIKPISQQTLPDGKMQLQRYVDHLPGTVKGTSLLSKINGKTVTSVNLPSGDTMDLRLITFDSPNQAGMIYYDFSIREKEKIRAPNPSLFAVPKTSFATDMNPRLGYNTGMSSPNYTTATMSSALLVLLCICLLPLGI